MFNALALLQSDGSGAFAGGLLMVFWIAVMVFFIACGWKLFTKAGEPGWAVLVPIYNLYVMLKIVGRPGWWLVLFLIPVVNFIVAIVVNIDLAKSFGKDTLYGIGITFLGFIFIPMLAFGSAQYQGPSAASTGPATASPTV